MTTAAPLRKPPFTAKTACAGASTETAMLVPRAGFTERDMEEMWQANCTVIRDVIAQTGIDAADIAGVACCGHGKGLYLWVRTASPRAPASSPRTTAPGNTASGKRRYR
ncbi:MAG: FGGY family carbohydrate kinase [Hydrogeniiclostridium mannosilyticum]